MVFIHELVFEESKCYFFLLILLFFLGDFLRNTTAKVSCSIAGHGWFFLSFFFFFFPIFFFPMEIQWICKSTF